MSISTWSQTSNWHGTEGEGLRQATTVALAEGAAYCPANGLGLGSDRACSLVPVVVLEFVKVIQRVAVRKPVVRLF